MKKNTSSATISFSTTSQSGFTLIELMVSLSLFIIVVLALVGSLYTVNDASRKVQAMRTVMDNISFSIEAMSRTIRTGENIICNTGDCVISPNSKGGKYLSTQSTLGEHRLVEFRWVLKNGKGMIEKQSSSIISVNPDGTANVDSGSITGWVAMTAPEIDIKKFGFYVDGTSKSDTKQPSVIIKMEGEASVLNGAPVPFAIQTYLSQRAPE